MAIKSDYAVSAINPACILSDKGDVNGALDLAYKIWAGMPDDPHVGDPPCWLPYKTGNFENALASLQASSAKVPDSPEVYYQPGMAYLGGVKKEEAKKSLEYALSLNSKFRGVEEAKKALPGLWSAGLARIITEFV